MEIKNIFQRLRPQKETVEHFFAVEVADDTVKTAAWTVIDGQTKVVAIGPTQTWDGKSQEALVTAVDQSISTASRNLPVEPNGVIFGLPESWSDEAGVITAKKPLLKFICEQLELKPLGFVVTDTALMAYLKIEEGAPPNAIFLQLNSADLSVNLVKMGKSLGTQLVGRSDDLAADVEEGLSRFDKVDTLPARMILYNGHTDFEEAKQQLISYAWEEKLPFIHFPKVEALSPETTIKALALSGGSEVAKSLGLEIKLPVKDEQATEESISEPIATAATAASLGFVSGTDIADVVPELEQESVLEPEPGLEPEPESLPVTDQPVAETPKPKFEFGPLIARVQLIKQKAGVVFGFFGSGNKLMLVGGAMVLLLALLIGLYWYVPKATVTLVVESRVVDESLTIKVDPKAQILDPQNNVLPGQPVEVNVSGTKSLPTTGTAIIGDPARGEVTLYNKTNQSRTFAAGTDLVGPNSLGFSLDTETTIASSSSSTEGITFGKATATVTADAIGPNGNLAAETALSFKQFSDDDYSAKVSAGLSGGTAREVKAVFEKDQTDLATALTADLQLEAENQLQTNLGADRALVPVNSDEVLTDQAFNHDEGEEADSLQLEARLSYTGLSYSKQELDLLLQNAIKAKVPDNFQLSQSSEINLSSAQLNDAGQATVPVSFKAKLIPKLDFNEIKNNLKGKKTNLVEEYLATLPSFVRAEIKTTPNLPGWLKTMPRAAKNITIDVQIEE